LRSKADETEEDEAEDGEGDREGASRGRLEIIQVTRQI